MAKPKSKPTTPQTAPIAWDAPPVSFVWTLLGVVAAILVYYIVNSPRPFDDDNITRYFMAKTALEKPEYFLNLWGRPLAIVFFVLPAQLGYWYCAAATAIVTLITCYFTYLAAKTSGRPYAWLVVPLLFFQPLFIETGFSVCTEPLAAMTLAIGLFYYYKQRDVPAALWLSLVPLARSEMVLVLPFFAIAFFRRRSFVPILLLGAGLVIYQVAGMIKTGDWLYLLTESKGFSGGHYQNGPLNHYFIRYIFITGPVVFAFLMLRLVSDIRRRSLSVLNVSVVVISLAHAYMFWKGNVAHIGLLRHFVAIAPMLALLALDGFAHWIGRDEDTESNPTWASLTLGAVMIVTGVYYSYELIGDYFVSEKAEFSKLMMTLILLVLFVFRSHLKILSAGYRKLMTLTVVVLMIAYVANKAKPLKYAPEHQTVRTAYDYYALNHKANAPKLMVAHSWWFFFDDYNQYLDTYETRGYLPMRKENLDALPEGGLVVWDSHYSWRLQSNVQIKEDLATDPRFRILQQFVSPDQKFVIYLFEKIKPAS